MPAFQIAVTSAGSITCANPSCPGRRRQFVNEKSFGMHLEHSETCHQFYYNNSAHSLLQTSSTQDHKNINNPIPESAINTAFQDNPYLQANIIDKQSDHLLYDPLELQEAYLPFNDGLHAYTTDKFWNKVSRFLN